MKIIRNERRWRFQPFPPCNYGFEFSEEEAPCWFHRLMQKWLLGFRWTRT